MRNWWLTFIICHVLYKTVVHQDKPSNLQQKKISPFIVDQHMINAYAAQFYYPINQTIYKLNGINPSQGLHKPTDFGLLIQKLTIRDM